MLLVLYPTGFLDATKSGIGFQPFSCQYTGWKHMIVVQLFWIFSRFTGYFGETNFRNGVRDKGSWLFRHDYCLGGPYTGIV